MALPNGIHSTKELLDAQAHICNHTFNFVNSMSLKCAVELGIPDIIHKHSKPMTLSELTDALAINKAKSPCIERLMRVLIHSNFFTEVNISENQDKEKGYWLTPASLLLLKDESYNMTPFVLAMLDPIFIDPFHNMSEWFNTNDHTPFVTANGRSFWEMLGQDPRLIQLFNESMACDTQLVTSVIVKDCRHVFQGLKSMVDVGGGTGSMAKAIAGAFPGLKCSVLDLPHVVDGLEGAENLTFIGGSMFESIPRADAVFMKWILHDWCDDECIQILKKCKQAILKEDKMGKVIIIDMVVDNNDDKEHKTFMETKQLWDVEMMVFTSGRERSEEDWAKLFHDAGFTSYNITHVLGLRSLIEVFP